MVRPRHRCFVVAALAIALAGPAAAQIDDESATPEIGATPTEDDTASGASATTPAEPAPEETKATEPGVVQAPRTAEDDRGANNPWFDEAVTRREEREERSREQEKQYQRNIPAVQVAFGREIVEDETDGWYGRAEFAYLIPLEDGASALYVAVAGLSGWGSEDAWGFGVPMGFGGGFRTPVLMFYAGMTFGVGFDKGAEPAAPAPGAFGNLGFNFGWLRLMGDARAEYRLFKAGKSTGHLSYGALLSVSL